MTKTTIALLAALISPCLAQSKLTIEKHPSMVASGEIIELNKSDILTLATGEPGYSPYLGRALCILSHEQAAKLRSLHNMHIIGSKAVVQGTASHMTTDGLVLISCSIRTVTDWQSGVVYNNLTTIH